MRGWSSNLSPFIVYSNSRPLGLITLSLSQIKFTWPFQSSSPSFCLRRQLSCYVHHRFSIQRKLGVNRLFSLAAWGNLLSPCSCLFLVFFLPFPDCISSSFFGFLHHCISLRLKGCWGLSLFLPEQTARGSGPAQCSVLHWGSWRMPGNFLEWELFPNKFCIIRSRTQFKRSSSPHPCFRPLPKSWTL